MAKMFIAGESTGSGSGQTYDVINPATGEVVDSAPKGSEVDARAAIDAAYTSFQPWAETAAETRAQLILKGIEAVKKEIPDLSTLLTREQGKPVGDSQREIEHFLHGMNFYAGRASKIRFVCAAAGQQDVRYGAETTGGCRRGNRALEFPDYFNGNESGTGPRSWLHRGGKAGIDNSFDYCSYRGTLESGGPAERCAECCDGFRRCGWRRNLAKP
jgi:hypothetical protein